MKTPIDVRPRRESSATPRTVYLLGAGVNRPIADWDGIRPPLSRTAFQTALAMRKYQTSAYQEFLRPVLEFIEHYWSKTEDDLRTSGFDLEECITLLDEQLGDAERKGDSSEIGRLSDLHFRLASFFSDLLTEFDHFAVTSETMRGLGQLLSSTASSILTLNYDCIIEGLLETASKVRTETHPAFGDVSPREFKPTREWLEYSHFNRNRPLGYGVRFDVVQLQQAGVSKYVEGTQFYAQPRNQLASPPILKLHGSVNWFRYLPIRDRPVFPGEVVPSFRDVAAKTLVIEGHWWQARPPSHDGWFLSPLIITPRLYKEKFLHQPIFETVWEQARVALRECSRLVIIGYSFPPTDFAVRRLVLEALAGRELDELTVVNPNPEVKNSAADLCHFRTEAQWFTGVDEFVRANVPQWQAQDRSKPIVPPDFSDTDPVELVVRCKQCGEEMTFMRAASPRSVLGVRVSNSVVVCSRGHSTAFDGTDLECVRGRK